jgi:hypothetical protein
VKRVLILVEGQTEETFVNDALAPHLAGFEKWPSATCICTKRVKGRRAHRGGIGSYVQVRTDLHLLLRSNPDVVTTLIDFYGIPSDFPGCASVPPNATCFERAAHLEQEFGKDIADLRFIPNLVLHEFEGLLFSAPRAIAEILEDEAHVNKLEAIASKHGSPEEINDSQATHPSKRIKDLYPRYVKPLYGPQIAARIGLPAIRAKCRHFNAWLKRIEDI